MLFPMMLFLILEDMPAMFNSVHAKYLGFFWGMLTTIVSLLMLINQPETILLLVLSIVLTIAGTTVLFINRKSLE
jgi:hypothetical protein